MKRTTLYKVLVLLSVIGCCAGRIIVQPASVPETSAPTQVTTANTQQSETAKAESGSIGLLGQAGAGGAGVAGVAAAVTSTVDSAAAANTTTVNETATAGPESAVAANGAPAQPPVETAAEAAQKPVARHPKIPMPAAGQHYKFEKVPQAAARPKPAAVVPGDAELGKLLNGTAFIPGACGPKPSSLGYQCSWAGPNGVVLHWSYNVSHPPINRCTTNNALPNAEARNNVTWLGDMGIHFALQVATKEKLHLGFIEPHKHRYYPTDGVHTGTYCSGAECNPKTPQVEVSYYANPSLKVVTGNRALRDPSIMEGWAAWASSDFDDLTGVLCFSRRANGTQLKVAGTVGSEVLMAYAVNSRTPYTYRAPRLGMVRVNFKTGSAAVVTVPNGAIRAHGALMLLAFAVLLPAGLLTSRHSWMFVDDKKETGLSPIWALVHMGLLALGALLALAGMIVALVAFGNTGLNAANSTHKVLGLIAVALILLLVVLHGLRPLVVTAPGQLSPLVVPLKAAGVLTIASSWATLFIGCVVARDFYAVPLSSWVPPCAILCGLVTMVAIALELRYQKLVRTGAYNPKTHILSNLNPLPLARIRTHREPTNSKKDEFLAPNQPYSDEFMPESNAGVAKSPMKAMGLGAKGPLVHIMAAAQGRSSSTSSGGSTPSSVTYRGRTSTASMPGNITGFPSHPGARMSENV